MNEQNSQEDCQARINDLSEGFEKQLKDGGYLHPGGHAKFKQELKTIEEKFKEKCGKQVKAEEVLLTYLNSKEEIGATILVADKTLGKVEKAKEQEEIRKRNKDMEAKIQEQKEAEETWKLEETKAILMKTLSELEKQMVEERKLMSEKLDQAIKEKEKERDLYKKQGLEEQAKIFQAQIDDLKKQQKK
ncbi:guanylate-binding protein 1-like [Hyperolius riggenbachi]|uniref:guanylate-binding protein 1-like n=1 Tax=Hyperolius riggenbachi TaxID=752182 RepID=UPI0035A2ACF5